MSANTRSWVAGLLGLGHRVEVITFHPGEIPGTTVHTFDPGRLPAKSGYLLAVPRIRRLLRRLSPDLVIGYYLSSYGFVAALSWRGPLVLTPAGSDLVEGLGSRLGKARLGYLARRGNLFVAWAQHMAANLERVGVSRDDILVVPRGIDRAVFRPDGDAVRDMHPCSVVSTRNFKPIYNLETSLRAIARVRARGVDAGYRLLGRGPLQTELQAEASRLGIREHVEFPGHFPSEAIASHLRGSRIYLSTALSDGASASLFEAMGCGCLPVVSDIEANREWIRDGENGLLVRPEDAEHCAEGIERAAGDQTLRSNAAGVNAALVEASLDRSKNLVRMLRRFERLVGRSATGET
jgi:glycosyltransferase involved in cell wall biosynthesis